jgi:hypothetical protein
MASGKKIRRPTAVALGVLVRVGVAVKVQVAVGVGVGDGVAVSAAGEQWTLKKYVPATLPSTTTKYLPGTTSGTISAPSAPVIPRVCYAL